MLLEIIQQICEGDTTRLDASRQDEIYGTRWYFNMVHDP